VLPVGTAQAFSELVLVINELIVESGPGDWLDHARTLIQGCGALDEPLGTDDLSVWLTAAQLLAGRSRAWLVGARAGVGQSVDAARCATWLLGAFERIASVELDTDEFAAELRRFAAVEEPDRHRLLVRRILAPLNSLAYFDLDENAQALLLAPPTTGGQAPEGPVAVGRAIYATGSR
jgi:hypothetical protein